MNEVQINQFRGLLNRALFDLENARMSEEKRYFLFGKAVAYFEMIHNNIDPDWAAVFQDRLQELDLYVY